jgi:hypothetical protein
MRRVPLTVLGALGAAVVLAIPAQASAPVVATGTFTILTDDLTPIHTTASDTTFYSEVLTLRYAGDLSGSATDTNTFVQRADGSFQGHGTEVCSGCSLAGRVGDFTATFNLQGRQAAHPATAEPAAISPSPAARVAWRAYTAKERSPEHLHTPTAITSSLERI